MSGTVRRLPSEACSLSYKMWSGHEGKAVGGNLVVEWLTFEEALHFGDDDRALLLVGVDRAPGFVRGDERVGQLAERAV